MACVNCKKIRSAILHGKMAEAAGLTVETFREKMGLSSTTPVSSAAAEPVAAVAESAKAKAAKAK